MKTTPSGARLLPTFVGIGAQRGGSTWLHERLERHPEVFVPRRRKEVHYFDRFYDRGVEWYGGFFPGPDEGASYRAVGEITPAYLSRPAVPGRIAELLPDCRIVVILRHPVDRLFSQYGLALRNGYRGRFGEFVDGTPRAIEMGMYARHLARYLEHFPRERILSLIFEEVHADRGAALDRLTAFLGVSRAETSDDVVDAPVNPSARPRFPRTVRTAKRMARRLRRKDLDRLVEFARRLRLHRAFGRRPLPTAPDAATRDRLLERYAEDMERLEKLLDRPLEVWRSRPAD